MTIHPPQLLPPTLYEHLPQPALYWPDARSAPGTAHPNAAYDDRHPPGALPDTIHAWPDGLHVRRLPTRAGPIRFCRVHLRTLPCGGRLATLEDVHDYHADPLTGLLDRRALHHDLATETPGSVVLLDIDGFKAVNDTLGHAAGDDVLCALAALAGALAGRWNGHAYRLGGDEFLLHTPRGIPAGHIEHLQTQFQRAAWRIGAADTTLSVGTAHAPQHGNTIQHLILHADAQLAEQRPHRRGTAAHHLNPTPPPAASPASQKRPRGWTRP